MPPPFRCVGRGYPNAGARAILACSGRVAPRILQFKWEDGTGSEEAENGEWQNAYWSDPGLLPPLDRTIWNTDTFDSRTLYLRPDAVSGYFWYLEILHLQPSGLYKRETYGSQPFDAVEFNPGYTASLMWTGTIGGSRFIFDADIPMRVGTYSRIPAGSCIGA